MNACQIPISNHTNFVAYNVSDSDRMNAAERIVYLIVIKRWVWLMAAQAAWLTVNAKGENGDFFCV